MPRMGAAILAAHMDNVLKLAKRKGGVSRPQLINELNVTRAVASTLIEKCELEHDRTEGRTEYFIVPNGNSEAPARPAADPEVKQSRPDPVKAVAEPASDEAAVPAHDELTELDEQIITNRDGISKAMQNAAKAYALYASNMAMVDALRSQQTDLFKRRMDLLSR